MSSEELSNNVYLIYNHNTVIEIDNSALSFITLLPIKSVPERNWKERASETIKNHDQDMVLPMLSTLDVFEIPTMFSKGTLGTTYKIIHFYERHTSLQKGLMDDISTSTRINSLGKDKAVLEKAEVFLNTKKDLKAETIANYEHYEKTDFIVVKTMFRNEKVISGEEKVSEEGEIIKIDGLSLRKKEKLKNHFSEYTSEKFKKDASILEALFIEHSNKYDVMSKMTDRGIKINQENIVSWFSKLSLSSSKTSMEDLNFIDNNILNYSGKMASKSKEILPSNSSNPIKVLDFYPEKITILNGITNKTKVFKVNSGEEVVLNEYLKSIDVEKVFYKNGIKTMSKIDSTPRITDMKVVTKEQNSISKSYFLPMLPPFIKENFSGVLANDLLSVLAPETFVQQTEIFRLPQKQLISQYNGRIQALYMFMMFPSVNGKIYDKQAVLDKIEALTSSINQVSDNNFLSCRYSFGYTKRVDNQKDEVEISNKLKRIGINDYTEALRSLNKVMLPWTYSTYILNKASRSTYMELSAKEVAKFINFKNGQNNLSFDRPRTIADVDQIKSSCFFVKTETEVMGVDIFKGPEKYNGLIIAPSGSGKSFFAVNMLDGFISSNENNIVWILDRGGSFTRFTDGYGGVNKELTLSSDQNSINPFGLPISFVLMVKLQYFEEYINKETEGAEGERIRVNEVSEEIDTEIRTIIRYLKILSASTNGSLFIVDDKNSLYEYEKMPNAAKQKLDILRYFEREDGTMDIKTEFFITQVQDTFAVLSSIVVSMLSSKNKDEGTSTAYFSMAPMVLRKIFIEKLNYALSKKIFIDDYENTTKEITSTFKFNNLTSLKYDSSVNDVFVSIGDESRETVFFKYEDEIVEVSNENVFFIIDDLKQAFQGYIRDDDNITDKSGSLLHLKEFDFYINELQAGKLFNVEPPKDLSSERLVNIDLGESQDERLTTVVPSALMMNFFKILTAPSKKGINKILLIDEAHAILGATNTSGLDAIAYLFRTARKHGGSIWLISQGIGDFHQPNDPVKAQKFEALIKNAGWRVLLGSGHDGADKVLGFSGDAVDFAKKTKEGADKYKMIIDMDGKTINVVDLVVSATDYWNSTTHPAEKQVLDMLALMVRDPQHAKMVASTTFNDSMGGMRNTYASIASLEEANPAPTPNDVFSELKIRTGINYSELEKSRIFSQFKTVHALMSETRKAQVSIKEL